MKVINMQAIDPEEHLRALKRAEREIVDAAMKNFADAVVASAEGDAPVVDHATESSPEEMHVEWAKHEETVAEISALRAELAMTRIVAASHDAELGARAGRTCPSCVYSPHCVIRLMAGDTDHPFGCTEWDARPEELEEGA